jgi:VanZ family protein
MKADAMLLRRLLWAVLTAGLFLLAARLMLGPAVPPPEDLPKNDKLWHAVTFAALIVPTAVLQPRWLWPMAAAALVYGGLIELIQPSVGRTADLRDFLADAVGIGLVLLLSGVARRMLRLA